MNSSRPLYFILLLFALCTFWGCNPTFDQSEQNWLDVYDAHDTLIFKSDKGEFDSSFIVRKEILYGQGQSGNDTYGIIWYKNRSLKYHPDGDQMVSLVKATGETTLSIDYLYSGYIIADLGNWSTKRSNVDSLVVFDTYRADANMLRPKSLYWDPDKGLVKYVSHDDVVWNRIN